MMKKIDEHNRPSPRNTCSSGRAERIGLPEPGASTIGSRIRTNTRNRIQAISTDGMPVRDRYFAIASDEARNAVEQMIIRMPCSGRSVWRSADTGAADFGGGTWLVTSGDQYAGSWTYPSRIE
jgi:hypothetical protein